MRQALIGASGLATLLYLPHVLLGRQLTSTTHVFVLGVVAIVTLGFIHTSYMARRKYKRVFGGRAPRDPEDVFSTNYASRGIDRDAFVRTWRECATVLGIPPDLIRATDRLNVELAPVGYFHGLDHPLDDLGRLVTKRLKQKAYSSWPSDWETFGDVVVGLTQVDQ